MLHQNTLMKERIAQLEKQNEELSKRKSRKRKRIQNRGVLKFSEALQLGAAESPAAQAGSKKARRSDRAEAA